MRAWQSEGGREFEKRKEEEEEEEEETSLLSQGQSFASQRREKRGGGGNSNLFSDGRKGKRSVAPFSFFPPSLCAAKLCRGFLEGLLQLEGAKKSFLCMQMIPFHMYICKGGDDKEGLR